MDQNLTPPDELTQVKFVMDYIQLSFHEWGFSFHNEISIDLGNKKIRRHDPGFCDVLVGLIGQRAQGLGNEDGASLVLAFDSGKRLVVHLADGQCTWSEAWELYTPNAIIVEPNLPINRH